jgi:predicted patatin/cPLA2 family phospholipase
LTAPALLHGTDPQAVVEAILERHARRRRGDFAPDGRRLALVIEGGALRAVCSAGGAVVLAQLGFSELFDEVHATSAAVMNASYFMSNQPLLGISVYFDNCTTRHFINPLRFWKVVDVDYVFDRVAVDEKPLDVARVLRSPSTLYVAVMDRRTGEAFVVDTRAARTPFLQVLKASAALPVFYNRAVEVDGRPCMDGGLRFPFGLGPALAHGCTHVLVLSTRPADYVDRPASTFDRLVFDTLCARGNEALRRAFAEKHEHAAGARALALGRTPAPRGVSIATICADAAENIPRLTTDRATLLAAATSYGRRTLQVFGGEPRDWGLPTNCGSAEAATELRARAPASQP